MKNKVIGIIGAMDTEVKELISEMDDTERISLYGNDFYSGRINGVRAVVVKCGIGKVNAARCAQIMIDKFEVSAIVNSGIAGGVSLELNVGDICLGSGMIQHDYDLTPFGYVKGYISTGLTGDEPTIFKADRGLLDFFKRAAGEVAGDRHILEGIIISGDQFIADLEKKKELHSEFGAIAAEMEGAAIAQVAAYAEVPFVVLRVISDLANGEGPASFEEFEKEAADLSMAITNKVLELMD